MKARANTCEWAGGGISLLQVLGGMIPKPTRHLKWGEAIPPEVMHALYRGETALLHGPGGEPEAIILMDHFGQLRECRRA